MIRGDWLIWRRSLQASTFDSMPWHAEQAFGIRPEPSSEFHKRNPDVSPTQDFVSYLPPHELKRSSAK